MAQVADNNFSLKALVGDKLLVNKDGEISEVTFDASKAGDKALVGFYFSAHWCPVWLFLSSSRECALLAFPM